MINVFQIASNDQSIAYLAQIFGGIPGVFPGQAASISLLGTMFKTFNSVVLGVGALILVYVTVVGVLQTAHEGEFLGKKWHSLWTPLRMVLGIAALVPSPSGYSGLQIVMMWVIVQGIGAGDTLWTTALNYINVAGSPYASVMIPEVSVSNNMESIFQGLVCQASAKATSPITAVGVSEGGYYCATQGGGSNLGGKFCSQSDTDMLNTIYGPQVSRTAAGTGSLLAYVTYYMGPNGACGTFSYCNKDYECKKDSTSLKCAACTAQEQEIQKVVNTMGVAANAIVAADIDYRQFFNTLNQPTKTAWIQDYCSANGIPQAQCCRSALIQFPGLPPLPDIPTNCQKNLPLPGDYNNATEDVMKNVIWPFYMQPELQDSSNFIEINTNEYIKAITDTINDQISQQTLNTNLSGSDLQKAQQDGWIFAGAYYFILAQQNDNNLAAANPTFTVNATNPKADQKNILNNTRNNFEAAGAILTAVTSSGPNFNPQEPDFDVPSVPEIKKITSKVKGTSKNILSSFMNTLSGSKAGKMTTNPLSSLQSFGRNLLIIVQAMSAVIMQALIGVLAVGYISPFVLGSGVINPVGPVVSTLSLLVLPLMLGLIGAFFIFGVTLAVYLPLVPYIIFTFGVIGWFILTIEAMIAAPLVALGIMSPSSHHHEVLGKAEPALMLIFSIFLRPSLMIFGMMAAMLLSAVVITMINAGFGAVFSSIYANPGLLELLLFIAAYVFLVTTALNKCFALIHIVPDRVLRWISGSPESTSEEGLSEIKGGVTGAGGQALGGIKGAVSSGTQGASAANKYAKEVKAPKPGGLGVSNVSEAPGKKTPGE